MRILIYENDLETMLEMDRFLTDQGFDVVCCQSQNFVNDYFDFNDATLVIIDCSDDDGIDTLVELKCSTDTFYIKVIATTDDFECLALKYGMIADEILDRPIDLSVLNQKIIALTYDT